MTYLERYWHPFNIKKKLTLSALPFDFTYKFKNVSNVRVDGVSISPIEENGNEYEIKPAAPASVVEMDLTEDS